MIFNNNSTRGHTGSLLVDPMHGYSIHLTPGPYQNMDVCTLPAVVNME